MNLEAAILYVQQRMMELSKSPDEYHYEPVLVTPSQGEVDADYFFVKAYNEIYILIDQENFFGTFIRGDNSSYHCDLPGECGVPEFTGFIHFHKVSDPWSFSIMDMTGGEPVQKPKGVEFLRVVY